MEEADKEARLVGLRLLELQARQQPVWDENAKAFRPVAWNDIAILLRSPSGKAESYAKEFSRLNIPLQVARGGFYQSKEISDLLSLLQLLDNPLQDLPVLAVLHSPLVGLTLDELALIRLTVKAPFWVALMRWQEGERVKSEIRNPKSEVEEKSEDTHHALVAPKSDEGGSRITQQSELPLGSPTLRKVTTFLERHARWRRLARQVSLSRCLETVLTETHYGEWLLTQPRGEQRHANVQRLLDLAQQFDQFQRQSLFRFLRFIEAQKLAETEPEVAPVNQSNSVRLMSIHQSKGLEFPIVALADLGKRFNLEDLRGRVILDEELGLCPQVKPPGLSQFYPSLPHWLAQRRQKRETCGEELRLLYVALTRARDQLILSGAISAAKHSQLWQPDGQLTPARLLAARSYSDWLGGWFAQNFGSGETGAARGENALLRWAIHDDAALLEPAAEAAEAAADSMATAAPAVWQTLQRRLAWTYPFLAATRKPAKTSVTLLRRAAESVDGEARNLFQVRSPKSEVRSPDFSLGTAGKIAAVDVGNAHHAFLQFVSLERVGSIEDLHQEAQRLEQEGALSAQERAALDLKALAAFWQSDVGRQIRAQARLVQRELAFTARFSPSELAAITGEPPEPNLEEEFIVVQGAVDLAVLLPGEIWLLDFKTDHLAPDELPAKVKLYEPQVKLYAEALARIYRRPVTACWIYFLSQQAAVAIALKA